MALYPHTITAIAKNTTAGSNIVPGAIVSLLNASGVVVTMYDDASGSNGSTGKTADTRGQVTVYIEQGEYSLSVNGTANGKFVTVSPMAPIDADTFANLELATNTQDYQNLTCRERANAAYALQPSGYVAQAGDATLANGRVAQLQRNQLYNQTGIGAASIQQTGFTHVAVIGDSLSDETYGPLTSFRNAFYSEFGYGGQYWAFLDGSPGFTSIGFSRNPTTAELSYTPDLRARADDNFDATKFASLLNDDADYDFVRVYYLEQPSGCTFAVGPTALGASGALTIVDTLSATTQVNFVDVPKASGGGGAITVRSSVDGKICLIGVELLKNSERTYGGRVTRMAKGGAQAAEIAALDATQYTQWLTWFNPEVVFINLGMNDRLISTASEIMAFVTTINNRIPAGIKRVFVAPNAPADYMTSALPDYAVLLRAYTEANDYGFIDNTDILGTYNRAVDKALMSDTVHPNDSGRSLTSGNYLNYIGLPAAANATQPPDFSPIGGSGFNYTGDLDPVSGLTMTVGQTLKIYTLGLNRSFTDAMLEIKIYSKDQSSSLLSETRFALKNGSAIANYVTEITPIETTNVYKYTQNPGVNEITHSITSAIVSNLAEITFSITTGNVGGEVYISASYISPKAVVEGFGVIQN